MSTGHRPENVTTAKKAEQLLDEIAQDARYHRAVEVPPPSEGGPPFTLAEIDESIRLMERRLETGQGTRASAMCRLSLDATKALRGMVADAQADVDRHASMHKKRRNQVVDVARDLGEASDHILRQNGRIKALESEVAQLKANRFMPGAPHGIDDCPTYYDGCNCTMETLEHNIERAEKAEAEVARLLQRTWDEHQDNDHPCTCHDCLTYAQNSGLWVEVTDGSGRVVDFKPAVPSKENG
jgi:hypothetical protein